MDNRNFFVNRKLYKKNYGINEKIEISDWFLMSCIFFSILIIVAIIEFPKLSNNLIKYTLPHNEYLNILYVILDPLLLVVIMGIFVFSKYFAFLLPHSEFTVSNISQNWKKIIYRYALSALFFLASLLLLNLLENHIIKPLFSVSRPIYRLEHSIANSIYETGYQDYRLNNDFSEKQIESKVLKALYRLQNDSTLSTLNQRLIYLTIIENDCINCDSNEVKKSIEIVMHKNGNYKNDISIQDKYYLLKQVYGDKEKLPDLWLTSKFEDNKENDLNSTPSGFIIRIVFIWFLGIILITQKKYIRKRALIEHRFSFILLLTMVLLIVSWSRVYGFYHTFYDELISFTFVDLFVIALILIYYVPVKNKLKTTSFLYNKYYNEVPENFYITDDNDYIVSCNRVFEDTFGFEKGEAIGIDIKELYVDKQDRQKLKEILNNSRCNSVIDYLVYVHKYNKPDENFVISVNSVPYLESKSNISNGIEGTARIISKIINNLVDGFYQVDNNEIITYCNNKFSEIFGYKNNLSLKGKMIRSLYYFPNEREKFLQIIKRDKTVTNFLVTCKKFIDPLDTSKFDKVFVEVNSQFINPENPDQGIQGTIRELPFGQAIITHSFHGIYVIQKKDEKYKFAFCNENILKIFGYQDMSINRFIDEIEVNELIAPEEWDRVRDQIEVKLLNEIENIVDRYVFIGVTKTGKKIPIEINSNHYPLFQNHPAVIGNLRDLTEDIANMEKVSLDYIVKTTRTIFHEIYNPLNGIRMSIQRLRDKIIKGEIINNEFLLEKYDNYLHEIDYCTYSQEYLRFVYDSINIPLERLNLAVQIDNSLKILKNVKQIAINIIVDNNIYIKGNKTGFEIIFINLLKNSIESIKKAGRIDIWCENQDEDFIYLFIKDSGTGIDKAILNSIFDQYTLSKKKGHFGLGLHVVKTILTNWHGRIEVIESNENGTLIKLSINKY